MSNTKHILYTSNQHSCLCGSILEVSYPINIFVWSISSLHFLHKTEVLQVGADITSWRARFPHDSIIEAPLLLSNLLLPEYCILLEEKDPVWKNPQQIFVFCALEDFLTHRAPKCCKVCGDLIYTTDHNCP